MTSTKARQQASPTTGGAAQLLPPWSFHGLLAGLSGRRTDPRLIDLARAMTEQPPGHIKPDSRPLALKILAAMRAGNLELSTTYQRLLGQMAHAWPDNPKIERAVRDLLRKLVADGRHESATAFFDTLIGTRLTNEELRLEFVNGILGFGASHFTSRNPGAPAAICRDYFDHPEVAAFARLPQLACASSVMRPGPEDAPMLKAVLGRKEVIGALRDPVVQRLFDRAAAALPEDVGIARLCLARLRSGNRLKQALPIARSLSRLPEARIGDLHSRIEILLRLDQLALVRRYIDRLAQLHDKGLCTDVDFANRLWAAGFPRRVLAVLGGPEGWLQDEARLDIALRSLRRLRLFDRARELGQQARKRGLRFSSTLMSEVEWACSRLQDRTGPVDPEADPALWIVEALAARAHAMPSAADGVVTGRVMLTTQSIGIGGAERQVTGFALALVGAPDVESVQIVANKESHLRYDLPEAGGKLSYACLAGIDFLPESATAADRDLARLVRVFGMPSVYPFYCMMLRQRPEVVHVRSGQHIEVALAAVMAGVPTIVVHFGSMRRGHQSAGTELAQLREALLEKGLAILARKGRVRFVANSRMAADDWAEALELEPGRIGTITNSIEPKNFRRSQPVLRAKPADGALVVGGVFRFAPVKDPILWVEVAAQVAAARPNVSFLMIGDGPMRGAVEREIARRDLQGHFRLPGLVTSGLETWLERMDVFLMTSRTESLPNAVMEAQLMGLPVVAPDVGGISEAFANAESGRVCPRRADRLAAAVIGYLDDEAMRGRILRRAPPSIMARFSTECQLHDARRAYRWKTPPASDIAP